MSLVTKEMKNDGKERTDETATFLRLIHRTNTNTTFASYFLLFEI